MLSSLGARTDRSPTGRQPPQKVFVQEQEVLKPETQPQPGPMIAVQECQEEKSQIRAVAKPQLRKESVEDFSYRSKTEAHAQPQVLPEVKSQDELVGFLALGEPKIQKGDYDKETMESQPYHLDIKKTPEHIQQTPPRQQPLTVQLEPKQTKMQLDTQHQTQGQRQQVQVQKQDTSLQQTLLHQSVKERKSHKGAENRPWLQQKARTEVLASEQVGKVSSEVPPQPKVIATAVSQPLVSTSEQVQAQATVTWIQQQQPITASTIVASQAQVSTTGTNQAQAKRITQTHAKVTHAQQQQPVLQSRVIEAHQQQPVMRIATGAFQPVVYEVDPIQSESKSVIQTQFQVQQLQSVLEVRVGQTQQVTQSKVVQIQQQQPVSQAKLGQVHQQLPISQILAKEQVQAAVPVISQKQPQALTIQQHPQQFTATTFTQPPTKQSETQPPVMAQTQPPIMSQACQCLPATEEESQTMRHPPAPVPLQIITQRQQYPVAAQSPPQQTLPPDRSQGVIVTPAQPKSTAPIQPRIITMPQGQPQFYKPPQSPPQVMGMGQTHGPQSHIQQTQWRPVMPDLMTKCYDEAPQKGFVPCHMTPQTPFHSQSHPQSQVVAQTPAQLQQWAPLRGDPVTQTYTSVQGSDHVRAYPHSQGYPSPQPQSQQWGQFISEPTVHPYPQISPQSPVQSFVPPQHWQPIRQSYMVRHSYPQVQMSEHQVTTRLQSLPQHCSMQPELQSQVQCLKMFPQPMANTSWNQPSSDTPVRPQGPAAPEQPRTQQQQWSQNKLEVPFQVQFQSQTLQSQPQCQVLQKQPQQQFVAQVKPPALAPIRPQCPAPQQPLTQQQQLPENRAEAPFQIQSQTPQIQPQVQDLQKPQ